MKKLLFFFAAGIVSFCAQAQNKAAIHGQIKDLQAGQWIYYYALMNSLQKDSVKTTDGGFDIPIEFADADGYVIRIGDKPVDNSIMLLYVDKGKTVIKGNGPLFKDAQVSGTKAAADYEDYERMIKSDSLLKTRADVYKQYNALYKKKDSAGMAALEPVIGKMDSVDKLLTEKWITAHHSSPISAFLISRQLGKLPLETRDSILQTLTAAARDNGPAKRIANSVRINNLTGIGKVAPNFTQNDTLDQPRSLADFRGKYVLVDFWASWCMPCRAENPNVVAAYAKYKDHNFTVIGISLDRPGNKESWLKAIHTDHLEWTQLSDLKFWNNEVAKAYDINSIPSNFLLDPNGKIIAKDLHGDELEKELAKIL